jgi:hypothetical protein
VRNWDYRYCWLRDATLTLLTLLQVGYRDEASAWRQWLLRAIAGSAAQMQIMYGVKGERWLDEREVPWLSGYENSKPVRVGNAASNQFQLDVFGEVLLAMHQSHVAGLETSEPTGVAGGIDAILNRTGTNQTKNLGSPRRSKAIHPFQNDGVGGIDRAVKLAQCLRGWHPR